MPNLSGKIRRLLEKRSSLFLCEICHSRSVPYHVGGRYLKTTVGLNRASIFIQRERVSPSSNEYYFLFLERFSSGIYFVKYAAKIKQIKVNPHVTAPVHCKSICNPIVNINAPRARKIAVKKRFMLTPQRETSFMKDICIYYILQISTCVSLISYLKR